MKLSNHLFFELLNYYFFSDCQIFGCIFSKIALVNFYSTFCCSNAYNQKLMFKTLCFFAQYAKLLPPKNSLIIEVGGMKSVFIDLNSDKKFCNRRASE